MSVDMNASRTVRLCNLALFPIVRIHSKRKAKVICQQPRGCVFCVTTHASSLAQRATNIRPGMKTRRKSKTSLPAAPDSDDAHVEFFVPIPEDIDTDSLLDILPDTDFSSPSPETIANIYRILLNQAFEGRSITQDLDEAKAEIEKKEVELDQALQDKESVSKDCEAQLESVQKDLAQVKQGRDQLGIVHCLATIFLCSCRDICSGIAGRSTGANYRASQLPVIIVVRGRRP